MANDERKLQNGVTPKRYRIELAPELDGKRVPGSVSLDLEFRRPTSRVVLDAAEIDIHSAVIEQDGVALKARRIEPDADQQTAALDFGAPAHQAPRGCLWSSRPGQRQDARHLSQYSDRGRQAATHSGDSV